MLRQVGSGKSSWRWSSWNGESWRCSQGLPWPGNGWNITSSSCWKPRIKRTCIMCKYAQDWKIQYIFVLCIVFNLKRYFQISMKNRIRQIWTLWAWLQDWVFHLLRGCRWEGGELRSHLLCPAHNTPHLEAQCLHTRSQLAHKPTPKHICSQFACQPPNLITFCSKSLTICHYCPTHSIRVWTFSETKRPLFCLLANFDPPPLAQRQPGPFLPHLPSLSNSSCSSQHPYFLDAGSCREHTYCWQGNNHFKLGLHCLRVSMLEVEESRLLTCMSLFFIEITFFSFLPQTPTYLKLTCINLPPFL